MTTTRYQALQWPPAPADWSADWNQRFAHPPSSILHSPSSSPPCPPPEVHVWAAWLDAAPPALAVFAATLSSSELERAARFHFELHRNRFIVGRGLLRTLLGGYLQTSPRQVEFAYGPQGKPSLAGPFAGRGLHFNLAHSEDLALLAVTPAGAVGIDVERVRPLQDAGELVARFFSPSENSSFQKLPEGQKPAAFFNLWTRKEALLKATGEGIAHSLHRVEVSFLPGEPAWLLSIPGPISQGTTWRLHELAPADGFAAALAIGADITQLHCWQWTEPSMQVDSGKPGP